LSGGRARKLWVPDTLTSVYVTRIASDTWEEVATVEIARNYRGRAFVNGPEFLFDGARLGVAYAGPDGVHAAWRSPTGGLLSFSEDVTGEPIVDTLPPALPAMTPGRFPAGSPPFGLRTYNEFFGWREDPASFCEEKCYGFLDRGIATDIKKSMSGMASFFYSTPHPSRGEAVLFTGCEVERACGVYQAHIDGAGGIHDNSLVRLIDSGPVRYDRQESLIAGIHPVTRDLLMFALRMPATASELANLEVWACGDEGAERCGLVSSIPVATNVGHFRVVTTPTEAVLHYLVRETTGDTRRGSYLVRIDPEGAVGAPVRITPNAGGDEVLYIPRLGRLFVFFRDPNQGAIIGCPL
jgi:hypothetical protein